MANAIGTLGDELISDVVASVPTAWLSNNEQRNCILSFLTSRKARVRGVCSQLKEDLP